MSANAINAALGRLGYGAELVAHSFQATARTLLDEALGFPVLHLGDHDPSGLDMTRDLRDRLSQYARSEVDVRRVALNMDQVEAFQPPPNPAKESDKRFKTYRREYGDQCWELDALPPEELARLTREAIEEDIDWRQWAESTTVIEESKASLRKLVDAAKA
ncbi:MAG: hypothetical protein ACT4QB_22635 [Gammaproteobacteria bacterium]